MHRHINSKGINLAANKLSVFRNGKIKQTNGVDWSEVFELAVNPFLIMSGIQGQL